MQEYLVFIFMDIFLGEFIPFSGTGTGWVYGCIVSREMGGEYELYGGEKIQRTGLCVDCGIEF